ncbi:MULTISPECIES: hypothetical protein [Bacteria]|uniref:hypothetical protein n=1 Tax=Bacteria TaxID=2 RepID=UPI003C7C8436
MDTEFPVLPRRTVVKGAAWSLPVIATAIAVPAASASVACQPGSAVVTATGTAPVERIVVVPAAARTITFRVQGGAGGGPQAGGAGAVVTGQITPTGADMPLLLVAGGRGHSRTEAQQMSFGFGGGGMAGNVAGRNGTGGGAGSAILRGGMPLVVAGGGGGAGATIDQGKSMTFSGVGGAGGAAPTSGQGNSWTTAGLAAVGTRPGTGGVGKIPPLGASTGVAGGGYGSGQPGTSGGGRNGGGVGGNGTAGMGGGGGGGLAGGGGGASAGWVYMDTRPAQNNASGGGAGSSLIAIRAGVAGTVTTGPVPSFTEQPGSVTVSWTC